MDPVGSWSAYAASYNHRVDGGGSTTSPFNPGGFLSPPSTYDHTVFAPLFHQKAHYGPVQHRPHKPNEPDPYYPQVGSFEQPANSVVWSQATTQLPSPFGVLPHESVVTNSFTPNFQTTNHQIHTPQFADLKRRPNSPLPKPNATPNFFQPNFILESPTFQKFDYNAKLYQNGLQQSCVMNGPTKDFRISQTNHQFFQRNERERNFLVEKPDDMKSKVFEVMDRRDPECQSSPISFAMIDAQRNYQNKTKSPEFVETGQGFRYGIPTPDSEFQRSKSSESFSSSSSSNGPDCNQRPSNSPVYSLYTNPGSNSLQQNCYKQSHSITTLDSIRNTIPYSSVITRNEKNNLENRFDEIYGKHTWDDRQRKFGSYEAQNIRMQQFDVANQTLPPLQDLSSCREDPMSLVKNLHHSQPDKQLEERKKKNDKELETNVAGRVPPPAHHNSQNGYSEFERWTLPPPTCKPVSSQPALQPKLVGNIENQPEALVVPGPVPYQPPFQMDPPPYPVPKERPVQILPSIEEELAHLASDEDPPKPFYAPNPKFSFIDDFIKFIQGEKEEPSCRTLRKTTWSKPCSFPKPISETNSSTEFPSDPQDDPRYYPLPKSSDMRSFDTSEDSSDDGFGFCFVKKSFKDSPLRKSKAKPITSSPKKKKVTQAERSTQTSKSLENNTKCKNLFSEKNSQKKMLKGVSKKNENSSKPSGNTDSSDEDNVPLSERAKWNLNKNSNTSEKEVNKQQRKSKSSATQNKNRKTINYAGSVLHFKVGDFLIQKDDEHELYPPLWRVKENNILQKYQHFVKDGVTFYTSLPLVVSLRVQCRDIYHPLPVKVSFTNKSTGANVVQVISYPFELSKQEKEILETYMKSTNHLQDSFEVFIQTLFSQSLDSNFLQEIYDEKDEYFLCNVRTIEETEDSLNKKLVWLLQWPRESLEAVSRYPNYRLTKCPRSNAVCVCLKRPACLLFSLHGNPYNKQTLHRVSLDESPLNKDVEVCRECLEVAELVHRLSHSKLALFAKCRERVSQNQQPEKDTTVILNQLLADEPWLTRLFREVRIFWHKIEVAVEKLNKKIKSSETPS